MELVVKPVELEASGIMDEDVFGVADMGFILQLFRESIYSNKVAAICREISCNARDAHREVGKAETPIRITLPNHMDPNLRIRDFGPGISPDRMKNVFIKYGASTKRNDNVQTGGFGIGAKTPFGYTDSFAINTFIKGVHRSYTATIDDTRRGKLSLMDERPTMDQPDGTEIIIPIQTKDFEAFRKEVHFATRHWKVKPEIRGGMISYNDFRTDNIVLSGENWMVCKEQHGNRAVKLVVDEIEYPFEISWLDEKVLPRFGYSTTLYLRFPTGKVSLSATRESVDLDDNTKRIVTNALKIVKTELNQKFEDAIKNAPNYIQANIQAHKITSSLNMEFPSDLMWNGKKLHGLGYRFDYSQATVAMYTISTSTGKERARKERYSSYSIEFDEDTIYAINDVETCTEAAVRAVFKQNPGKKKVAVVKFLGNAADLLTKTGLVNLNWVNVSSCYTPRKGGGARSSLGRLIFYKWDDYNNRFSRSSIETYENDGNKKAWISLTRDYNKEVIPTINKERISNSVVTSFTTKFSGYSIYGFMDDISAERLEAATEEMTPIEEIVEEYIEKHKLNLPEIAFAVSMSGYDTKPILGNGMIKAIKNGQRSHFIDQNNALLQYADMYSAYAEKVKKLTDYGYVLSFVPAKLKKPYDFRKDFKVDTTSIYNEYPMLKYMERHLYDNTTDKAQIETLIQYVNTVDKARGAP
jgi:hypothetical protein